MTNLGTLLYVIGTFNRAAPTQKQVPHPYSQSTKKRPCVVIPNEPQPHFGSLFLCAGDSGQAVFVLRRKTSTILRCWGSLLSQFHELVNGSSRVDTENMDEVSYTTITSARNIPASRATLHPERNMIWAAFNIEVLRAEESEVRLVWSSAGKRDIPEKTSLTTSSHGTIPTGKTLERPHRESNPVRWKITSEKVVSNISTVAFGDLLRKESNTYGIQLRIAATLNIPIVTWRGSRAGDTLNTPAAGELAVFVVADWLKCGNRVKSGASPLHTGASAVCSLAVVPHLAVMGFARCFLASLVLAERRAERSSSNGFDWRGFGVGATSPAEHEVHSSMAAQVPTYKNHPASAKLEHRLRQINDSEPAFIRYSIAVTLKMITREVTTKLVPWLDSKQSTQFFLACKTQHRGISQSHARFLLSLSLSLSSRSPLSPSLSFLRGDFGRDLGARVGQAATRDGRKDPGQVHGGKARRPTPPPPSSNKIGKVLAVVGGASCARRPRPTSCMTSSVREPRAWLTTSWGGGGGGGCQVATDATKAPHHARYGLQSKVGKAGHWKVHKTRESKQRAASAICKPTEKCAKLDGKCGCPANLPKFLPNNTNTLLGNSALRCTEGANRKTFRERARGSATGAASWGPNQKVGAATPWRGNDDKQRKLGLLPFDLLKLGQYCDLLTLHVTSIALTLSRVLRQTASRSRANFASEEFWLVWGSAGMKERRKWEIPEKTHRPTTSPGTIPTCENPVFARRGSEPGLRVQNENVVGKRDGEGVMVSLGTDGVGYSPLPTSSPGGSNHRYVRRNRRIESMCKNFLVINSLGAFVMYQKRFWARQRTGGDLGRQRLQCSCMCVCSLTCASAAKCEVSDESRACELGTWGTPEHSGQGRLAIFGLKQVGRKWLVHRVNNHRYAQGSDLALPVLLGRDTLISR
ncbi:hypothetical protein PR048_032764 [Dryococelus australis]|uniref:Uncharacterized protein n=1 Tax=Dryococelus australis TaxID=614101 RepID=A0ABQ9G346_9NEOP|nr:hypothetical protein PR048_032764 [Dryococelus australis]